MINIKREYAFTLFEMVISIAIMGIIIVSLFAILNMGLGVWSVCESRLAVDNFGNEILDNIEKGFVSKITGQDTGLTQAVILKEAHPNKVVFIPLYTHVLADADPDNPNIPDTLQGKTYTIDSANSFKTFQAGSNDPIVILKRPGALRSAKSTFDYETKVLNITETESTNGYKVLLAYLPDMYLSPETQCTIAWERIRTGLGGSVSSGGNRLYRRYIEDEAGQAIQRQRSLPLYNPHNVTVENVTFRYYDRTGKAIVEDDSSLNSSQLFQVYAMQVEVELSRYDYKTKFKRFLQCRNLGQSVLVTPMNWGNISVQIPSSTDINTFYIDNLHGVTEGAKIELAAGLWGVEIYFTSENEGYAIYKFNGVKDEKVVDNARVIHEHPIRKEFGINLLNPDTLLKLSNQGISGLSGNDRLRSFDTASKLFFIDKDGTRNYTIGEPIFRKNILPEDVENPYKDAADEWVYYLPVDEREPFMQGHRGTCYQINESVSQIMYKDNNLNDMYDVGEPVIYDYNYDGYYGGSFYDLADQDSPELRVISMQGIDGFSIFIN